ncbi:putative receptor-like protein kinase [Vitis vinifera]|uniref:Putative receptor-like protein kinase n=1 Tax=Vitis vinifera TaxID=29760 RepID=A0A438KPM3_VITVI|nr:putative receptor-like protein kinase [Vitis vinifera]
MKSLFSCYIFSSSFLLSLQCLSSDYTPPSKYFINCGSSSTISDTKRTFVGDVSSDSFTLSPKQEAVEDSSPSPATSQLYRTARLFRSPSSYEFDIDQIGIYLVRLHFFPFSSPTDLFTALFDVSVSGLPLLLHNFTVQNTSNLPLIKEFLLTINISKFIVKFEPSQQSSFAFVNAIEVFIAPDSFIPDSALLVTPEGSNNSSYKGISSRVLQKVHRINVGGSDIEPDSDTLWRKWVPDDPYLFNKSAARNRSTSTDTSYQLILSGYNDSTRYIAPPLVYMSAKEMNKNGNDPLQFFNISWGFDVSKNAKHLLRVHFCDFISISGSFNPWLNLYIYSFFSQKIDSISLGAPFFLDLLVVSDDSGFLNVSIGPQIDSPVNNSFLNGLEIMEIMGELGWVSMENESKKKTTPLLVGLVVGGLALVCIVIVVLLLRSKCRKEKPAEASHWLPVTVDGGLSSHSRVYEATIHGSPVPHLNLGLKIPLAEIQSATNNFSSKLLVGKGGFGKVYQGTLRNGMKVAVKRSQPGHGQGLPEFQTEILVLSKIRHRHLVSLIGYCDERNEMILVYEFMQNGTLRNHLYDSDLPCLSWKQRLEICIGAARGLHYLHTGLLHQTHVSTAVKGTIGYLDPDYQSLTSKEQVNLAEWVMVRQKEGFLEHVIDPLLVGKVNLNSLRKFGETAEKCLQEDGADRPTMGDVVWDLEYAFQLQQTAMQREPLDDSTNDAASTFPLPNVQRYPSYSLSIDGTHVPARRNDGSETTESEVFSQLRIDDGR